MFVMQSLSINIYKLANLNIVMNLNSLNATILYGIQFKYKIYLFYNYFLYMFFAKKMNACKLCSVTFAFFQFS